jgi:hypothetical protein
MSETSILEEPHLLSADTAESGSSLLIREPLPEKACPETPTASSPPAVDVSLQIIKEALIPLPVSPTSSSVTLEGCRSGITERQENGFLRRWQQWFHSHLNNQMSFTDSFQGLVS